MRGVILAILIISAIMSPVLIDSTDAAYRPPDADVQPAILCYYNDGINLVNTIYVVADKEIGSFNIPPTSGAINYWVRMDTGEVVTAESVFEPGTYMIKGYSAAPEPWGKSGDSSQSIDLGMIALVIAVIDLVGIGYLIFRRK